MNVLKIKILISFNFFVINHFRLLTTYNFLKIFIKIISNQLTSKPEELESLKLATSLLWFLAPTSLSHFKTTSPVSNNLIGT